MFAAGVFIVFTTWFLLDAGYPVAVTNGGSAQKPWSFFVFYLFITHICGILDMLYQRIGYGIFCNSYHLIDVR